MSAQHMDPQQAVTVFSELKCRKAVPIHWGVFELADESLDAPLLELAQATLGRKDIGPHFSPLKIGQSILPD
jgi:L-ascorbate metabolism protein UlaG (beta-lactamase superfamily)